MSSKTLQVLVACAVLLVFVLPSPVQAEADRESMTVTIDGVAPIDGSDYAKSRDQAIRAALENALAVVIEAEGRGTEKVEDEAFPEASLLESLYRNPSMYVSEYRILDESAEGDHYRVVLAANVLKGRVLAELESRKGGTLSGEEVTLPAGRSVDYVLVRINGIRSFSQYQALRQYLSDDIDCVVAVYPRAFQFQSAEFDVRLAGKKADCLEKKLAMAEIPDVPTVLRSSSERELELEVLTWSRW